MAWYGVGTAVVGGIMNSGSSQGGTTTQNKTPWAPAIPWLQNQIATGQGLQQYYQQNPFNPQQQQAYSNMAGNSNYARQLASSVLGQMNNYKPFSQANPSAQFQPYQFPSMGAPQASQPSQPSQNLNISGNPFANGSIPVAAPAAPAPQAPVNNGYNPWLNSDGA